MQRLKKYFNNKNNLLHVLPLGTLLLVQPFLVRFHLFKTGLEDVPWTNTGAYSTDLYLYWKSMFFLAVSAWMLVLLVLDRNYVMQCVRTAKTSLKRLSVRFWLLTCGYLTFVLLSALASDYPAYAWGGSIGQFESTFVLFSYIITGFYSYIYCRKAEILRKLPYFLMIQAAMMGIIGMFQYAGHDLFALPSIQRLLIPEDVLRESGGIVFMMERNRVYLTLYNPNYAGIYCACMIAVFFSLLLSERQPLKRLAYIVLIGIMTVCLIGAQSKTGISIISLAVLFLLFLHRKSIIRHSRILLPCIVLAATTVFLLIRSSPVDLFHLIVGGIFPTRADYRLEKLYTDADGLHAVYDGIPFVVRMKVGEDSVSIAASRTDGKAMEISGCMDGTSHFYIVSEGLSDIPVRFLSYQGIVCMDIILDGGDWIVTNQIAPVYLYLNRYGNFDRITMPETAVFTNYPSWLTYRGHIWARTIPLLKNHLLLGGGADTFLMEYPNDDYLGIHQSKTYGEYTTRPHCWYLQVAIQTGIVSLVFLLVALSLYIKNGIYFCIYNMETENPAGNGKTQLCEAFFTGTTVILLMNLVNDSSICTTPLLWCLIGAVLAGMEHIEEQITCP